MAGITKTIPIKEYGPPGHPWGMLQAEVYENGYVELVYETVRTRKRHYLFKIEGWGIEQAVMNDLAVLGVNKIRLNLSDETAYLQTTREMMERMGVVMQFPPHQPQVFLPEVGEHDGVPYWTKVKAFDLRMIYEYRQV